MVVNVRIMFANGFFQHDVRIVFAESYCVNLVYDRNIQKYSAIDELTALLLNELTEKIAVCQWRKDQNGKKVWDIEIYYRFFGKID